MLILLVSTASFCGEQERLAFKTVDVYIDAGANELGAYQFEALYDPEALYIVGVEGGDKPFGDAPFYDPEGLGRGRIIIASYTTGETRMGMMMVARLHLALKKKDAKIKKLVLTVSAGPPDARTFPARISLEEEGVKR